MALLHVHYFSQALGVQTEVEVILPEVQQGIGVDAAGEAALPRVLYLLHGYSDDQTIWQRRTSVERYAAAHNLAVIMPGVNHSFYCNEARGERYWDFVAQELPAVMHRFFRLSDKPEDTFVAGLSMGGYGALKLTLRWPERFAACGALSGAADIYARFALGDRHDQGVAIWGEDYLSVIPGSQDDTYHLTRKLEEENKPKPWIYQACGTEDKRLGENHLFRDFIRDRGYVYEYFEGPGRHNWDFWNQQIVPVLDFFVQCMEENGGR